MAPFARRTTVPLGTEAEAVLTRILTTTSPPTGTSTSARLKLVTVLAGTMDAAIAGEVDAA